VNKHRFRIIFENTILLTLVSLVIYFIVTFIISLFSDEKLKVPSFDINLSVPTINTNFLLEKFENDKKIIIKKDTNITNIYDINDSNNTKDTNLSKIIPLNNESNISKSKNDINTSIKSKKKEFTKLIEHKKERKKEIINKSKKLVKKEVITKKKAITKVSQNNSNEDMIKALRSYIKYTIIDVRKNAQELDYMENSSIKIRITVFKSGNYRKLTYMSGNRDLMEDVKLALDKTFPKKPNELIKSQFPRYLRFKINFNQQ